MKIQVVVPNPVAFLHVPKRLVLCQFNKIFERLKVLEKKCKKYWHTLLFFLYSNHFLFLKLDVSALTSIFCVFHSLAAATNLKKMWDRLVFSENLQTYVWKCAEFDYCKIYVIGGISADIMAVQHIDFSFDTSLEYLVQLSFNTYVRWMGPLPRCCLRLDWFV